MMKKNLDVMLASAGSLWAWAQFFGDWVLRYGPEKTEKLLTERKERKV